MPVLKVKLLAPGAKAPTVAHPGEDLGYDLYASETVTFLPRGSALVPTGIAVQIWDASRKAMGALLRDKSSMASKRLIVTTGVIDAGYRGEIKVVMENLADHPATIEAGQKNANLVSYPVFHGTGEVVEELTESSRMTGGFGASGK